MLSLSWKIALATVFWVINEPTESISNFWVAAVKLVTLMYLVVSGLNKLVALKSTLNLGTVLIRVVIWAAESVLVLCIDKIWGVVI